MTRVKKETIKDLRIDLLWLADQLHMTATDLRLEANKIEYRDKRIEELEAALRNIIVHCEVPAPPNAEALKMFARKALEEKDGLAAMEAIRLMQVEIYRLRELLQTISSTCDCWSAAEIRDKIRKELNRGEGKNVAE